MKGFNFQPKLFATMRGYTKTDLTTDVMAGIIVGIVASAFGYCFRHCFRGDVLRRVLLLPLLQGLWFRLLGGSKVQIGGPTGAFIVIIYGIIQEYGIEGLMVATMMAGSASWY